MKKVFFYGDSNTYGYDPAFYTGGRYPRRSRWTTLLAERLEGTWEVAADGMPGRMIPRAGRGTDMVLDSWRAEMPVDLIAVMLGTNDLKSVFGLSAQQIAEGAGVLVNTIQTFTLEKYGNQPKIVLISPPEIGSGICSSPFYGSFMEDAIDRSRQFPRYYREVAKRYGCVYLNAAEWIEPSKVDSLHLDPEAHRILAERLSEVIKGMY